MPCDQLQFAYYQEKVGVEDAILYLLHMAYSHLDKGSGVRIMLNFDSSSAFNTIQPPAPRHTERQADRDEGGLTTDVLDNGLPHQKTTVYDIEGLYKCGDCDLSCELSPVLFALYTSDFRYNSVLCHIQTFADDTAIGGCIGVDRRENTGAI